MCKVCLVFHFTSSLRANLGRIPKKTCLEQTTYIAFFSTLMVAKRLCKIEVKQSLTENIKNESNKILRLGRCYNYWPNINLPNDI